MPRDSISPTDADFIIFLILAVIFDIVDIILNILEFFIAGLPAISGWLDTAAVLIVGWWIYSVSKEKSQSQEEKEEKSLKSKIKGKLGRGEGGETKIATKKTTSASNIESKLMQKFIARMGGSFVIELIPIVSLLPMWTFNVLSVLGKETKKTIYMVVFGVILFMPLMLLAVSQILYVAPSVADVQGTCEGFNTSSELAKNIERCDGSSVQLNEVIAPSAKDYAISIGVPAENIKVWDVEEVRTMIKEEVAKQWASLPDKHGSTQEQAQRAILSYAHHEGGLTKFEEKGGQVVPVHDSTTFEPLSITSGKYSGCKNKQYAVAWDVKYAIYLGVKENFDAFRNNVQGEGEARWKSTIGYVFLPQHPNCYWDGVGSTFCREDVSIDEWNAPYNNEAVYVCQGSGGIGKFDPPTNEYGYIYPVTKGEGTNGTYCEDKGIDITVAIGTPVMSVADGKIRYIGIDEGTCKAHMKDQWCVPPNTPGVARIIHNDGRESYYAHMSAIDTNLKEGSQVKQGQIIGQSGTANGSPHLHISIYEGGNNWSPGKTERLWFNAPYNCSP